MLALAKTETPLSTSSIELIGILAPFQAKIQNAGITAAYVHTPKESIEQSLGMLNTADYTSYTQQKAGMSMSPAMTKEEWWEACYVHYIKAPEYCTLQQIQAAREHMYLNDLMSDEEIREFEGSR
jgi:hypothetical protein